MKTREQYVEQMKRQLDEMNTKIGELEVAYARAKADTRGVLDQKMASLRAQRDSAQATLAELGVAAEARWSSLVTEGQRVRDAFVHSFNYLKSQLKG